MQARYDIKLESTYMNANNDVEWFNSDVVHIEDCINSNVGEWKENPLSGIGIMNYLSSQGMEQQLKRKTILELSKDLYICKNPTVTVTPEGKLTLTPNVE